MPVSPPPKDSPERKPRDQASELLLRDRYWTRATLKVGLLGTLFLHLFAYLIIPEDLFEVDDQGEVVDRDKDYLIELAEEPEEPDPEFTQTNPDVPDNEPDETNRIAARNQQAAQEELPEEVDPENRPSAESDDRIETNQFLTGSLEMPELAPPPSDGQEQPEEGEPAEPSTEQPLLVPAASSDPLRKEIPLFGSPLESDPDDTGVMEPDFEKLESPTNVVKLLEGEAEEGEEREEEKMEGPDHQQPPSEAMVTGGDSGVPSPRPRPRLPKVPPGPVYDRAPGVSRTGTIATDAKFSEFGEYLERLIEAVSVRWNTFAKDGSAHETHSMVKLKFVLTKEGYIRDMELLETTAKAIGIYMCRSAIDGGQPYGRWNSEMVQLFGDEEEITFTFHYR